MAKIEPCDYDDGLGHRLTDEDYANGRLIAAAPDLLEACRLALTRLDDGTDVSGIIAKRVRAAIAKAGAA